MIDMEEELHRQIYYQIYQIDFPYMKFDQFQSTSV